MNLNVNEKLYGFTIKQIRQIPNKNAQLIEMIYEKTNTELCWYKSDEQNKLFGIAFKTLPKNDTGVFHILEHSVLCGSDKYPVKEPFVELLKSSMNTFLNAMTFPDKTLYPVSSRNSQDFLNLTSVYLDAVFAPKILTNPNIFYQEGWHYEYNDELTYNGVVFNEMKGAMSSVDSVVSHGLQELLFPDTSYGYNSGGDPVSIPHLTYDEFIHEYKENYHPTNARIYLDGDLPIDDVLKMIDEYLSKYEIGKKQVLSKQEPKVLENTIYYDTNEEDLENLSQLVLGKIICDYKDSTKLLATQILCDVLAGSNESLITKAIIGNGLGQDVSLMVNDGVYQPWIQLRIHNMNDKDSKKILEMIQNIVHELIEKGINKNEFNATINRLAFRIKEMQEPQGLIRCINSLDSWLYEGDPMLYLSYDEALNEVREMVENHGFEDLLSELFDGNYNILHVLASNTYGEEKRKEEKKRLSDTLSTLSENEINDIKDKQEQLMAWQQSSDTEENLATLPILDLSEINETPNYKETKVEYINGVKVLRHQESTNGINYLSMYFSLTDLTLTELKQLSFMTSLYTNLPTKNYSVLELQNEIKMYLGSLSFGVETYQENSKECTPYLCVNCSVLKENLDKAKELIVEILTTTDFTQENSIKDLLKQNEVDAQQNGIMSGHRLAFTCAVSHYSACNAVNEVIDGISQIQYLHAFVNDFDAYYEDLKQLANKITSDTICTSRLTFSITEETNTDITPFIDFKEGTPINKAVSYQTALPKKLGIKIPAQIGFVSMGYHLDEVNMNYEGSLRILSNIISLSYLWNMIRVQGGAYGAGLNTARNGNIFTYSYRDPSCANSINVYKTMANFIKELANSNENITKFIISTIAETESLMSIKQLSKVADMKYFNNFTYEKEVKERKEMLSTTLDDLLKYTSLYEELANNASICVVGYEDMLANIDDLVVYDI